jgi:hypothetical protein
MRVKQAIGERGSLRWIQTLIDAHRPIADAALRDALQLGPEVSVEWRSPLRDDAYAEYRDSDFLERVGLGELRPMLGAFWPRGGPQWDALARLSDGRIILVEAKAHASELRSHCTASPSSRETIDAALALARSYFGADDSADWTRDYYQYANRLAHLYFLRAHGVDAQLVFVYFLNDTDMNGPASAAEWASSVADVHRALGLPGAIDNVHECFIDTQRLA